MKLPVPSRPGLKDPRWPLQLRSVEQSSRKASGFRLCVCLFFTWLNMTNMSHRPTIHGNFLVQCSSLIGCNLCVSQCLQVQMLLRDAPVSYLPPTHLWLRGPTLVLLRISFEGLRWDCLSEKTVTRGGNDR